MIWSEIIRFSGICAVVVSCFECASYGPLTRSIINQQIKGDEMTLRNTLFGATLAIVAAGSAHAVNSFLFASSPSGMATLTLDGGKYVFSAVSSGWYDNTGAHLAFNPNYIVGNCAIPGCATTGGYDGEFHDFFVFHLGTDGHTGFTTATLSIGNAVNGFGGVPATYTNWDVTTPIAALEANNSSAVGIWNDLSSGILYATTGVGPADNGIQVSINLDAAALASLNAAAGTGSLWAVGGTLNPTGVPEPATWATVLIGFAGIGAALRRRGRPPATT